MLRRRPNALMLSGLAIAAAVAAVIVIAAISGVSFNRVGTPLGPALAAVVTYRLLALILVSVPSLLANRLLHPSLAR
jgi:hypothetical protein